VAACLQAGCSARATGIVDCPWPPGRCAFFAPQLGVLSPAITVAARHRSGRYGLHQSGDATANPGTSAGLCFNQASARHEPDQAF